jgi:S1-C subfamily serine protease
VLENSPGHHAGLEAYFDYIVSLDGVRMDQDNDLLKNILQKNVDNSIKVLVYNSKARDTRGDLLNC